MIEILKEEMDKSMKTCMPQNSERKGIKLFKTRSGTELIKKTETRGI